MDINKTGKLKNKKVLITAGPTWVPIDSARVISNIATGQTGILLSEKLQLLGAKVTLMLGPGECLVSNKNIRVIRFHFFDELLKLFKKELTYGRFDIVIHSAAVCDYTPSVKFSKKLKSGRPVWKLKLVPTPKIIDLIKKIDSACFAVGFKFEPCVSRNILIKRAKELIKHSNLDLAIANCIDENGYHAYIVCKNNAEGPFFSKNRLAQELTKRLGG